MDFTHLLHDSDIRLYGSRNNWWRHTHNIKEASRILSERSRFLENDAHESKDSFEVVFVIDHDLSVSMRYTIAHVSLGFHKGVTVDFLKGHHYIKHSIEPSIEIFGTLEGSCVVKRYPSSHTGICITIPESLPLEEATIEDFISQWLRRCGYVLGDIFRTFGPPPKAS